MSVRDYQRDEVLSLFEDKEISVPFVRPKMKDVMRACAKYFTLYGIAFIGLTIIEGYVLSFIPGVTDFLNSNEAVSLITGAVLLLINCGILYRYMNYADDKINDAKYREEDAADKLWRDNVEAEGYYLSRGYGFKNAWNSFYTNKDGVEYRAAAGHYDGKEVHLVLVAH